MRRELLHILLALCAAVAFASPAYAYVDPGAGSMLLQLLLAGAAGLLFFLRTLRHRMSRRFGMGKDDEKK